MKTIITFDALEEALKPKFEKVFNMRVPYENAVYQSNEEVEREYFKTGGIFYVKYRIYYTVEGKEYLTDRIILFFHKNGELAYCFFYDNFVVEQYHKFDQDGDKTIEAIKKK
ncbi:hypothetical protein U8527_17075 [Kordia algicida OT-1]|uniref:Uncharacterized protein n=1 Tax=Kordia algicida OT-1 TaxID=391587 RepID=A9E2K4_9FLAO|nr:hypothetical protein [Kordia algicida]EDP95400.1 hypothetical protein KAOT1_10771 [Kordia algicida OT-1]